MTIAVGLSASLNHPDNGMSESDMRATCAVADDLEETIIFRSTGAWSRRWIERGYPTKNFHVKGKSSDWGPQAGFVPYLGEYSKVGANPTKAADGTHKNDLGLRESFAAKVVLSLTLQELQTQLNRPEERNPRRALDAMIQIGTSRDYYLLATRGGAVRNQFAFMAIYSNGKYNIYVCETPFTGNRADLKDLAYDEMEVMTSSEAGAFNRPMTGDYDLMAVCPTWRNYMNTSTAEISKPGLNFTGKGLQNGLSFGTGARMDKVMDMRMNTGAVARNGGKLTYQGFKVTEHNDIVIPGIGGAADTHVDRLGEHGDMGNLTPRILRCINALNLKMNPDNPHSAFRRVHHNAESHRHTMFGALKGSEMEAGEGFPMTGFQPSNASRSLLSKYGPVCTLENMTEFREYATDLHTAGFYVPRHWAWGMSVRDRVRALEGAGRRGY